MKLHLPLAGLLLILATSASAKPENVTAGEMARLPEYCVDVQGFKYGDGSSNTSPRAARWVSLMGPGFWHMHHYCWARINLNRITAPGNSASTRIGDLQYVISDLMYVVNNTPSNFIMLPEVYTQLAEVELLRKNPAMAMRHVETAVRLKPGYAPPYQVWAGYLMSTGKTKAALAFLKTGLEFNPRAAALRELYRELGGDPATIVPMAPPPPADPPSSAAAPADPQASAAANTSPQ